MATEATKQPKFKDGDRVKLWGRSETVGTVDSTWFEGPNENVVVVWSGAGVPSVIRAHRLQHA